MDIFRSSLCLYIHPSIPAGALEETKDREDSVLRGGSPPFYLKGKTQALLSPCDSHKLLLAPRLGIHIHMHEWTDTSLSLFLQDPPLAAFVFYSFYLYLLFSTDMKGGQYNMQLLIQTPPRV